MTPGDTPTQEVRIERDGPVALLIVDRLVKEEFLIEVEAIASLPS